MKHCLSIIIGALLIFAAGCKKSESSSASSETKVNVMIKNGAGIVQPNITVYQVDDNKYNLYGTDPFFKDQQSVTTSTGIAAFIINPMEFNSGGQRTFYFFIKYSLNGANKTKVVGTTLGIGETKSVNLIMD